MSTNSALTLVNPKFPHNVGGAVRAASCFGVEEVRYTGNRFDLETLKRLPREERMKAYGEVTWSQNDKPFDEFPDHTPVAIELLDGSVPLHTFEHPEKALYIFGPEDGSIPKSFRGLCHNFVAIPTAHCMNLAAAIYVVLYDRALKRWQAGLEDMPSLKEE